MTDQQSRQAPAYLARLGLQREPFAAAPDPEFFCADNAHTQLLGMLQNLTEFGMLTLLVIGEPGMGKTSLLQEYVRRSNSNWLIGHLNADVLGNAHTLINDLANCFHVESTDFVQLVAQLDQMHAQGQLAVLVVDDAELLPEASLRTLLELSGAADDTGKRLRLVLFGTEKLQGKIDVLGAELTGKVHVFNIAPLSELQTVAYLRHRLKAAGLQEDTVFSPGQIKSIVMMAKGIPAQINAHAQQVLVDKFSTSGGARAAKGTAAAVFASPARRRALFVAAAVGVLLVVVALWPRSVQHPSAPTSATAESVAPAPEKTVELSLPKAEPAAASTTVETSAAPAEQTKADTAAPLPVPTLGPEVTHTGPMSASGKIAVSTVPAPETAVPHEPASKVAPPEVPLTTVTVPVAPAPAAKDAPRPIATPSPAVATVATPEAAPTKAKPVARTEAKAPPITQPARVPKPAEAAVVKGVASSHDNVWLKSQRPSDFTLQILGGQRAAAIRQFAAANRLEGPAAILQTTREGKPWFVLVYGAYPSRAAASQALAQLPATVRAAKPWPRSIATVQAEIVKKP